LEAGNKYKYTKAYFKIKDLILNNPQEKVFVVCGGQGASKTISIIQLIIQSLLSSPKEATILSSELSKMKRTVIRDYKKVCKDWGVFKTENDFNRSESKHEYFNESYLDFLGADVSDVGKGFRRDILYINEADKMDIETAIQFISRAKLTIIDYNPDALFWGDDFINENNHITLTYLDNEYLDKNEVASIIEYKTKGFVSPDLPFKELFKEQNIKNSYWANKWKVYGLGLVGSLDGVVFQNWKIGDVVPEHSRLLGYGMDYGHTNHPTALVAIYYADGLYYLDELIYQTGLNVSQIEQLFIAQGVSRYDTIVADSAEIMANNELRSRGWRVLDAHKPPNSRVAGFNSMQEKSFIVTKRSVNIVNEFEKFVWAKDKHGKPTNEPIKLFDDALDAARYYFQTFTHNPDAPRFAF
jgi:phage terminase large subunit